MARLNIPDESTTATFTVTAETSSFPFTFAIFEKADLLVQVAGFALDQSEFTLTGTLLEGGGYQGGTVVLNDAVSNTTVSIVRDITPQRAEGFGAVTTVPVRAVDMALNKQTALVQDIKRDIGAVSAVVPLLEDLPGAVDAVNEARDEAVAATATKADRAGDTFTGPTAVVADFQLSSLGISAVPAPGVYMGPANSLSFETLFSSGTAGGNGDDQRGSLLVVATTNDDGNSEEQTLCLLTKIQTGYSKTWATSTAFSLGDNVSFSYPRNSVYRCIQAGTSASSGEGPSGTGENIADGTVRWKWINDAAINAKTAFYNEVQVNPGAGFSWAQANNFEMRPGFNAAFAVNTEFDLTNHSGTDSELGGLNRYNLYLVNDGPNRSTAAIECVSRNTDTVALFWGLHFAGEKLALNSVIGVDASSAIGLGFGAGAGGVFTPTFTTATIRCKAITPTALSLGGVYSVAAINIPTLNTPAAINISAPSTLASIFDTATTLTAMQLNGTYSVAAINITGTTPAGVNVSGTKSVAGYYDDSTGPSAFKAEGTYSVADMDLVGASPSAVNIAGARTTAGIREGSTGPSALRADGTYTVANVDLVGNAPSGVNIAGTRSVSGVRDASTAPYGFRAEGTYGVAPFSSTNFEVGPTGNMKVSKIQYQALNAPASSSATGVVGEIRIDASYIYVCTATNTWKRAALTAY